MKAIKKAQTGAKTADSTAYFKNEEKILRQLAKSEKGISNVSKFNKRFFENKAGEAVTSQVRQFHKGEKGYDKNGYPIKKNGGSIAKAKDGKWMQKAAASIKKRGTAGKCTPITKPGCTGKAKALAKTFKKIAAKRKSK
jgi:hypothetical protein